MEFEKQLKKLIEITDAISAGNWDQEVQVDAEGILGHLASSINQLVRTLRHAKPTLTRISEDTPELANLAQSIQDVMTIATQRTLDNADNILNNISKLEQSIKEGNTPDQSTLKNIKESAYEIIAAQSSQDVARQELDKLENSLEEMRDLLIKLLVALKLKKDDIPEEERQQQQQLLQSIQQAFQQPPHIARNSKQDLVDELLAEFGL
jgi:chemotaxis protein CheZ